MTKARRAIEADLKLIDLVIELLDARIPVSSRNPDIDALCRGKTRLVVLNKKDLADPAVNESWLDTFQRQGIPAVLLDSRQNGMKEVEAAIRDAAREKTERDRRRGILNRPARVMVAGIPNVGKSTFINSLAKKGAAKTGNRPGVTKGNQWIRLKNNIELLDTPGILWPRFDDEQTGIRLALVGSISEQVLDTRELARIGIRFLKQEYPGRLAQRYGVEETGDAEELIGSIAEARNLLGKGGQPDTDRAVRMLLEEFRNGKLGGLSLERPEDTDGTQGG